MTSDLIAFDGLGYFLYRSTAVSGLTESDLEDILEVARQRNKQSDLTGCLHHEDGLFFQWLEGPSNELQHVVASILKDHRHYEVAILNEGPLDQRRFQDWRMRFSDRGQASLLDWFASSNSSTVDRHDYAKGVTAFLRSVSV